MDHLPDMPDHSQDPLVRGVLRQLPERDAAIVAYRFGLNDGQMHTLVETAAEFGVDDKAIRRCESTVLVALRAARGGSPELGD